MPTNEHCQVLDDGCGDPTSPCDCLCEGCLEAEQNTDEYESAERNLLSWGVPEGED